jgi:hypothetical protein
MRWVRSERGAGRDARQGRAQLPRDARQDRARWPRDVRLRARPGWPVVLLAAFLGAGIGATVPQAGHTAAAFVDDSAVAGTFEVRPCSYAWSAALVSLAPTRHYDFAATGAIPGNTPSPGLLVCDPSGALRLSGGLEESVPDPAGTMSVAQAASLVLWASITDSATPGDLVWLTQDDGADLGLRVTGGLLQLVQAPLGGGPVDVLAQVTAPDGDPHLLTLTRSGPTTVRLWVDTSEVAMASTSPVGAVTLTLRLGARPGSGASSVHAVLDEVVVLPAELGAGDVASLVATNTW